MGAKRSKRRSGSYEKDQSGCMWGLISVFDFRHGRTTRKLIADKKQGSKHVSGPGISKNKFVLRNLEENYQGIFDGEESAIGTVTNGSSKPSVKKLIEEEMVNEQCLEKEARDGVFEHKHSEPADEDQIKAGHQKAKKTRKKICDMDNPYLGFGGNLQSRYSHKQNNIDQQSVKDLGIDEIMEEFSRRIHQKSISCMKDGPNGDATKLMSNECLNFEEKLRVSIKEFMVQKLTNVKHLKEDQKIPNSKELMNELELISSDELFLKLLQDPQSLLERSEESVSFGGSELSEQMFVDVRKSEDLINHKHRSFFSRKFKSQERILVNEDDYPDNLNRIVILKPGSLVRNSKAEINNNEASDGVGSHFSISEIKRRLKHAMGKPDNERSRTEALHRASNKHQTKGDTEKGVGKRNVGRNSPTKEHFYIERIIKPSDGSKRADKKSKMKDVETSEHENNGQSNIYIEAKKYLSEMLSTGDGVDLSSRQNPNTLGRILSLPEYNTSPVGSHGRDWEKSFVTARTRFSSKDEFQFDETEGSAKGSNNASPSVMEAPNLQIPTSVTNCSSGHEVQAPNSNTSVSDIVVHEIEVEEAAKDEMSHEDDSTHVKEDTILDVPSGSFSTRDDQNGDVLLIAKDKSQQDSNEENILQSSPPGSPSNSLIARKVLDLEISTEIPERPSPVSVLEPVYEEDEIIPVNTISQPNEAFCGKGFFVDKDAIFGYVKAVMQSSGFDWDEVCIKLLSTGQLLNPTLVDEVELFSNQLCRDELLLFDCINEVLVELCQYYFGSSPWASFTKSSIRPIPDMKNATLETFKGVLWHLLQPPLPRTLDQIVRKDMERTRMWLDARFDTETIGFDLGEAVLEDLMEDTILSYVDESSESKHGDALPDLKESEATMES